MENGRRKTRERELMRALITLSAGRERFLASPAEIAALLPAGGAEGLDEGLSSLAAQGYADFVTTDRKGERTFVFALTRRGAEYFSAERKKRRRLAVRVAVAALCGAASALAGFLLKIIFL